MIKSVLQALAISILSLLAPVVCLFYRRGIWLTPDDTVSPLGQGEPRMRYINERFGTFINDWWWCGVRNPLYGLAYRWKPLAFKWISRYAISCVYDVEYTRFSRTIRVWANMEPYVERTFYFRYFHVIVGYRLRPVVDEIVRDKLNGPVYVRHVNMDARPIFSIRWGRWDD